MDRLRLVDRRLLVRWLAPAVFLVAVTAVVLVVRAGLRKDTPSAKTTPTLTVTTAPAKQPSRPTAVVPRRYYVIQTGDTLDAVAGRYGTSVTELLRLNPGIQPTALRPGQRIRVA